MLQLRKPPPATAGIRSAGAPDSPAFPAILRVFWGIWFTAVSINVVVWLLVTVTSGQLAYPWPLWVAGPYGAALFAISAAVSQSRRHRRPLPTRHAATPVVPAKS